MRQDAGSPRRLVLRGAVMAGAVVLAGGACLAQGRAYADGESANAGEAAGHIEKTQYGFLVKTANCVNCGKCVEACRLYNRTPEGMEGRRRVECYESAFGRKVEKRYVSFGCMHCEHPSCMEVCPAKAISKRDDGIVVVDSNRCIGCKYCYQACPFGVPHYGENGMDKCDCCLGNGVTAGQIPRCAEACMFDALNYGVLSELEEKTFGKAKHIGVSTGPSYLLV